MSSLMVSNLEIMMLEFAIDKLFVPKTSIFDSVIMKKTTVMFRMLDDNWTGLNPHRKDYAPYRGSNLEEEDFHGGKSIVFAIPRESLEEKVKGIDIQIHVRKEVSKYFEMEPCQNVGIALVSMDNLFNGIIRELRERKELEGYLSGFHKRQPISRSLKGTYEIIDEDLRITGAKITLYVRLSHFGKSVITEIEPGAGRRREFYAQEETNQSFPYHCKEVTISKLEAGYWGSEKVSPPVKPNELICHCDTWEPLDESDDKSSDNEEETRRSHPDGTNDHQPEDPKAQRTSWQSDRSRDSRESRERREKKKKKGKRRSKGDRVSGSSDDGEKSRKTVPRSSTKGLKTSKSEGNGNTIESLEDRGDKKVGDGVSRSLDAADGTKESSNAGDADREKRLGQPADTEIARKGDRPREGSASAKRPSKSRAGRDHKRRRRSETSDDTKDRKIADKSRNSSAEIEKFGKSNKSSKEEANRRVQLRKRPRGVITVGLREKEEKICRETSAMPSAPLLPVCETSASIKPTIYPNNLHPFSFCCHRTIPDCKPGAFLPTHSCSMVTRNGPWHQATFGTSNNFLPPDTGICTN